MSRRGTIALVAVDALLALTLVAGLVSSPARTPTRPLAGEVVREAASVTVAAAGRTELRRVVGGWSIERDGASYPARPDRVDAFLAALAGGTLIREVTDDPVLHERFGLVQPRARSVVVEADGPPFEFLFGDPAEAPGTLYYRAEGEPTVWLAEAPVDFYLRQPESFWAYLRLLPEDAHPGEAVRLTVELSAGGSRVAGVTYSSLELTREANDQWTATVDGQEVAASPVRSVAYARDVVDVVGGGFYDGDTEGLPTLATLGVLLADGRTYAVELRTDGETIVLLPVGVRLPGAAYGGLVYTAPPERIGRLVPDAAELVE